MEVRLRAGGISWGNALPKTYSRLLLLWGPSSSSLLPRAVHPFFSSSTKPKSPDLHMQGDDGQTLTSYRLKSSSGVSCRSAPSLNRTNNPGHSPESPLLPTLVSKKLLPSIPASNYQVNVFRWLRLLVLSTLCVTETSFPSRRLASGLTAGSRENILGSPSHCQAASFYIRSSIDCRLASATLTLLLVFVLLAAFPCRLLASPRPASLHSLLDLTEIESIGFEISRQDGSTESSSRHHR